MSTVERWLEQIASMRPQQFAEEDRMTRQPLTQRGNASMRPQQFAEEDLVMDTINGSPRVGFNEASAVR